MTTPYDPPDPEKEPRWPAPAQDDGQGSVAGPGYASAPVGPPRGQATNGLAVASLVLGLVSVILGFGCSVLFGLAGPAALILGKQAQRRADDSGGTVGGRGMARAGYTLGIIGTIILVLQVAFIVYLVASGRGLDIGSNAQGAG